MKAGNGRISYAAIIAVQNPEKIGTVVIQINARLVQDRSGLPELLLSNEVNTDNNLQNYSYARYENQKLVVYHPIRRLSSPVHLLLRFATQTKWL